MYGSNECIVPNASMEFEFVLIADGSNSTASKSTKLKLKILLFFLRHKTFSNFPYMFLNPNNFNFNPNCSNLLHMRNLQEQVKKTILLPDFILHFHCLYKLF